MTTIQAIEAIGIDPDIRNGRAYLLGTTVTVRMSPLRGCTTAWMRKALPTGMRSACRKPMQRWPTTMSTRSKLMSRFALKSGAPKN